MNSAILLCAIVTSQATWVDWTVTGEDWIRTTNGGFCDTLDDGIESVTLSDGGIYGNSGKVQLTATGVFGEQELNSITGSGLFNPIDRYTLVGNREFPSYQTSDDINGAIYLDGSWGVKTLWMSLGGDAPGSGSRVCGYEPTTATIDFNEYTPGDANFDTIFNSSDLIQVFAAGKYEQPLRILDVREAWMSGDWNQDGRFNSSDLSHAFSFGGPYSVNSVVVPEPSGIALIAIGLALLSRKRR